MVQNLFSYRPATLWKKRLRHSCFSYEFCKKFKNTFFTEHFRTTASEYWNNMPRAFKTKCKSNDILVTYLYILMASTYMRLNYNISIDKGAPTCKNKTKPYQCISNHKARIITFFVWPQVASENMFEVKRLAQLKVGG